MRRLLLLAAFFALALALAAGAGAQRRSGGGGDAPVADALAWTAYGGDKQLTGFSGTSSVTASDASGFALQWAAQLDGGVVATPLVLDGRVYAATEAGSVYALDLVTGALVWKRTFGTQEAAGDCGTYGISGTGAITLRAGSST